jgi:CheY-like chemotaxis protein
LRAQRCKPDPAEKPTTPNVGSLDAVDRARVRNVKKDRGNIPRSPTIQTEAISATDIDPQTLHILVVEDNKINQTVLARQLRLLGCTVYTADHGLEALELLDKSDFHISPTRVLTPPIRLSVILMDIEMPIMDGLTCVRRIRQMEAEGTIKHVPVIAVTANARSDQISGAMEAGMVSSQIFFFPSFGRSWAGLAELCI